MKTTRRVLQAACLLPLLSSCASYYQGAGNDTWSVKPFTSVRDSTDKPDAFYQLGRYYQGQNRYDQAILAYGKALAADGNFTEARNGLAVVYAMQGKFAEAVEEFHAAILQSPNAAHIHNNLGYTYYLQGLYGDAVVSLEKAAALEPGNQGVYNNLALAYAATGDQKPLHAYAQPAETESPQGADKPGIASDDHFDGDLKKITGFAAVSDHALSLPSHWSVATNPSTPAELLKSRIQLVEISPNVFELLRAKSNPAPSPVKPFPSEKEFRIEVSNGNGVTGMGRQVARLLRDNGLSATRLTNQKPYRVQTSQIHYREGYQAEALRLQSSLPNKPTLDMSKSLRVDVDVRLVLGKDAIASSTRFVNGNEKINFAI